MKLFFGLLILFMGSSAFAEFTVVKVNGEVFLEEKLLVVGAKVADGSLLESKDSAALVQLKGALGEVVLKGDFQFELPEVNGKEILARLLSGKVRVRVPKGKLKDYFHVRTPTAVAGVRGTDFYLSYWPLLSEAEIICFESSVTFSNADNKSRQLVKAGHWGGLGGRFGKKIAPPIQLSPAMLEHFGREISFQ